MPFPVAVSSSAPTGRQTTDFFGPVLFGGRRDSGSNSLGVPSAVIPIQSTGTDANQVISTGAVDRATTLYVAVSTASLVGAGPPPYVGYGAAMVWVDDGATPHLEVWSTQANAWVHGGGNPGGSSGQFQYNNAGVFAGAAELTRQPTTLPQIVIAAGTVDPSEAATFQAANDGFGGLLLADDSATQALLLYEVGGAANLNLGLLNGSFATPTKAIANDQLATISFEGYNGTFMDSPASIKALAASDGDATPFRGLLSIQAAGSATTLGMVLNGASDSVSIGTQLGASAEVVITPHVITLGDFAGGGTRPLTASNTGVVGAVTGASGSFTSADAKTVTVSNGIITSITT